MIVSLYTFYIALVYTWENSDKCIFIFRQHTEYCLVDKVLLCGEILPNKKDDFKPVSVDSGLILCWNPSTKQYPECHLTCIGFFMHMEFCATLFYGAPYSLLPLTLFNMYCMHLSIKNKFTLSFNTNCASCIFYCSIRCENFSTQGTTQRPWDNIHFCKS